jgi:hypothetical protein
VNTTSGWYALFQVGDSLRRNADTSFTFIIPSAGTFTFSKTQILADNNTLFNNYYTLGPHLYQFTVWTSAYGTLLLANNGDYITAVSLAGNGTLNWTIKAQGVVRSLTTAQLHTDGGNFAFQSCSIVPTC